MSKSALIHKPSVLLLGAGYCASFFAEKIAPHCASVQGTTRRLDRFAELAERGIEPILFDGTKASPQLSHALTQASHIIVSAAPLADPVDKTAAIDPALYCLREAILTRAAMSTSAPETVLKPASGPASEPGEGTGAEPSKRPLWVGYLSTIGVYGDAAGEWVDETSPCHARSLRSRQRLAVELQWQALSEQGGFSLCIFRLPGIYGPGRNALLNVQGSRSRLIIKPGQVFNRVHVADIATAMQRCLEQHQRGVFNICDDQPSPPQDVLRYAARLLEVEPPPAVAFASAELSPMARSFYSECKRVSNARSKSVLNMEYQYPNFKAGLHALWESGSWRQS